MVRSYPLRWVAALLLVGTAGPAAAEPPPFRFDTVVSLDDMRALIRREAKMGTPQDEIRRIFVAEGGATLIVHPTSSGTEKYVYDINLCQLYVWRWNISADYSADGALREIYVNGEPVFDPATIDPLMPKIADKPEKRGGGVYMVQRPRPEASKGENSLGYVLIDADGDRSTTGDQILAGGGPTRADPKNPGTLHGYKVAPWRSIFDHDEIPIMPYGGACP